MNGAPLGRFDPKNVLEDVPANDTILECRDTRVEHVASCRRGEMKVFGATLISDVDSCCIGALENEGSI